MMSVLQLRTMGLLLLLEGTSAQTCDTFTCTTAGTVKVGNPTAVLCASNPNGACDNEYCCTASCSSFTCATGYTNWGAGLQCRPADFGGCTQDTCCRSNTATPATTADTNGATNGDTTADTANGGTTSDTTGGTTDTNEQQVNIVVQVITLTATATTAVTTTTVATTATTAAMAATTTANGAAILPEGGAKLPEGGAIVPPAGVDSMPGNAVQAKQIGEALAGLWSVATGHLAEKSEGLPHRGLVAWAGTVAGILGAAALVSTVVLGRYRGLAMEAEFEALEAGTQLLEEQ